MSLDILTVIALGLIALVWVVLIVPHSAVAIGGVFLRRRRSRWALRCARLGRWTAIPGTQGAHLAFLLGRIAAAAGELEEALVHFEAGTRCVHDTQGGDGLLAWGDALDRLGRPGEALAAWRLAVGRDPQSESASIARERLAERGPRDVSA